MVTLVTSVPRNVRLKGEVAHLKHELAYVQYDRGRLRGEPGQKLAPKSSISPQPTQNGILLRQLADQDWLANL